MTDNEVLELYVKFVPFLGEVLGEGVEIIIHDVTDMEHSLIAMCNGISGRHLGNPITDLARNLVEQGAYHTSDYLTNYTGKSADTEFLSSTYYIKNEGRLIGLLCINKDVTSVRQLDRAMKQLFERFNLLPTDTAEVKETFDTPVAGMMHNRIAEIIEEFGVTPARMSMAEKSTILHRLKDEGVLTMKGAMAEVASQLGVSVPTAYRYLSKSDSADIN